MGGAEAPPDSPPSRTMAQERYEDVVSLLEDMEGYPDGISLPGVIGSDALIGGAWHSVTNIDRASSRRR